MYGDEEGEVRTRRELSSKGNNKRLKVEDVKRRYSDYDCDEDTPSHFDMDFVHTFSTQSFRKKKKKLSVEKAIRRFSAIY